MKNIILFFGCCMALPACNDDEQPPLICPDEPITAHFTMGQGIREIDTTFYGDTILTGGVTLEAPKGYTYYEWQIGEDYTRQAVTERSVFLIFEYPEPSVAIRLIVHGRTDLECFPNDDGIDTLTRHLTVINSKKNPIQNSRFQGYLEENPDHLFTIEFTKYLESTHVLNLNEGCLTPLEEPFWRVYFSYRRLYFVGPGGRYSCESPKGLAVLSPNNRDITIDFTTQIFDRDLEELIVTPHKFIGKKIP